MRLFKKSFDGLFSSGGVDGLPNKSSPQAVEVVDGGIHTSKLHCQMAGLLFEVESLPLGRGKNFSKYRLGKKIGGVVIFATNGERFTVHTREEGGESIINLSASPQGLDSLDILYTTPTGRDPAEEVRWTEGLKVLLGGHDLGDGYNPTNVEEVVERAFLALTGQDEASTGGNTSFKVKKKY